MHYFRRGEDRRGPSCRPASWEGGGCHPGAANCPLSTLGPAFLLVPPCRSSHPGRTRCPGTPDRPGCRGRVSPSGLRPRRSGEKGWGGGKPARRRATADRRVAPRAGDGDTRRWTLRADPLHVPAFSRVWARVPHPAPAADPADAAHVPSWGPHQPRVPSRGGCRPRCPLRPLRPCSAPSG